ncbi:hypothetical protein lerEdw1_013465 [Lerista edwardsae]|nr:hypothetical protein lerEdw1_013469 [Lerista edwardsae]KAJ6650254.1 hypothetical protein lerEdw1_013465 [Lerista edwardsae]
MPQEVGGCGSLGRAGILPPFHAPSPTTMKEYTEIILYPKALDQSKEDASPPALPLPQFLLTEFSNPVFEKDGETPGEIPPEVEDRRSVKPSANGFAQQVQDVASRSFKPDCRFSWFCVAVLSTVLLLLLALLVGIIVSSPCGGVLHGPQGSFSSPNYPDPYPSNTLCRWHIQVAEGMAIQLKVGVLDIESSASCLYDRLEIYKEQDAASLWDGSTRYCGTVAPPTINTNTSRLQVVFVSDDSFASSGFTAWYRAIAPSEKNCSWDELLCDQGLCLFSAFVCDGYPDCTDKRDEANCSQKHNECGGTLTGLEGQLFSPNYPQPYPPLQLCLFQLCLWKISVPAGHVIELHFHNFSLESQEDCNYDFVEIFDSAGMGTTNVMGRFCSSDVPPVLTSSKHVMTVLFVADEGVAEDGFFATYRAHNTTENSLSNGA